LLIAAQFDVSFRQFATGISRQGTHIIPVQLEELLCHIRGR